MICGRQKLDTNITLHFNTFIDIRINVKTFLLLEAEVVNMNHLILTKAHLLENRIGTKNHWVELRLRGTATNRDAAGARITLVAGGVSQLRDVQVGGGSFNQQRPLEAHFGLADNTTIDSVTVHWVGGGTETFTGVQADHRWQLVEGTGSAAAW